MNDKDLVIYLRQADHNAHMGFGGDWKSVYAEAADHIEAQEKLIEEIMFGLRLEFGPAGPSRSTPLGRIFGKWLEEHRGELG